ncbi:hypothetical protein KM043_016357 [Ampulex compressa]|nr:hypothetical protein KM043_016357 [Ampulex compressa]
MLSVISVLAVFSVAAGYKDPNFAPGHDVIVHLFEWKWMDIAKECEDFLGPMGYGGVQVSPIQENVVIGGRPWWERYQPISYVWGTRSGNAEEFADMVQRCNKVGVRIYVDVLLNHMSGNHPKAIGTAGSRANTYDLEYYAVPYTAEDFNALCSISNYQDAANVRNCELSGLHDLNQSREYVREKMVEFLNRAIDAGVAGFRIDAAKHMWPQDLKVIYSRLHNLSTAHGFANNSRPYIFQEVIDWGNEAISKYEYNDMAAVTEFKHGHEISNALRGNNLLKWFVSWGEAWSLLPSKDALVFIDNHDTQRNVHSVTLTYRQSKLYKMAVAFMLAHPYGTPRVMSSFDFHGFNDSPPSDGQGNILSPIIYEDDTCGNGWICEHRWRQIYNMARFRNAVNGTAVNGWWDNGANQIAFCRGTAGFVALNGERSDLRRVLDTCMPPGKYCDVISGNLVNGRCTGKTITVGEDGKGHIEIRTADEDGVLAIHHQAKLP